LKRKNGDRPNTKTSGRGKTLGIWKKGKKEKGQNPKKKRKKKKDGGGITKKRVRRGNREKDSRRGRA